VYRSGPRRRYRGGVSRCGLEDRADGAVAPTVTTVLASILEELLLAGIHRSFAGRLLLTAWEHNGRIGLNLYGAFGVKRISSCASLILLSSIAPVAARWHDRHEFFEVEIDNGLKRLGGGTIAQAVGQRVVPGGILGLQRDQLGDGVVPALSSGPSVRRSAVTDLGKRLLGLAAGAISRLSFGVAEGVLVGGVATLWHALFSVT
jgi:hypothetical protein